MRRFAILILFILTHYILWAEEFHCSTHAESPEVQRIINLVNKRMNIHSLRCTYTIKRHPGEYIQSDFFGIFTYDFIYRDGNFVIKRIFYPEIPSEDNPRNLFELLVQGINRKKRKDLHEIAYSNWNYYYYNGKSYVRSIKYYKDGRKFITSEKEFTQKIAGEEGDPRCLFGYFGKFMFSIYAGEDNYLPNFLNMPGKFYYYEKDGFRILWHEVPELKDKDNPYDVEVWIDPNENIVKLKEGYFFTRIYPHNIVEQTVSEYLEKEKITCDAPVFLVREYNFSEFIDIDNEGARLPLKATIFFYTLDPFCMDAIQNNNKEENFPKDRFIDFKMRLAIKTAMCPTVLEWSREISIHKGTLIINEIIPEAEISPPTPDFVFDEGDISLDINKQKNQDFKELLKNPLFFFSIICIVITLVIIFLTRKYLGWSI